MSYYPVAPARALLRTTLAATSLLAARGALAQDSTGVRPDPRPTSGPACVRALPASALTRVPVFVYAEVADTADRAARPAVDLVADAVARRVRAALGRADTVVAVETTLHQRALGGHLRVVARRGGGVAWGPVLPLGEDSTGVRLLARAMRAAADSGDYFVPDDVVRGDSLVFRLDYTHPVPAAPGGPTLPVKRRNSAPVFLLDVAAEKRAALARALPVRYPAALQADGVEGDVVLEFVVDAAGRAEPGTLVDAAANTSRARAEALRGPYHEFAAAARDAVLRASFTPAEVGGCRVRQLVRQPVRFRIGG